MHSGRPVYSLSGFKLSVGHGPWPIWTKSSDCLWKEAREGPGKKEEKFGSTKVGKLCESYRKISTTCGCTAMQPLHLHGSRSTLCTTQSAPRVCKSQHFSATWEYVKSNQKAYSKSSVVLIDELLELTLVRAASICQMLRA